MWDESNESTPSPLGSEPVEVNIPRGLSRTERNETGRVPLCVPQFELQTGDTPESARVGLWLVDIDDPVEEGERLVELLIPGVNFDVSSPAEGIVATIEVRSGATVHPGDVLAWIEVTA